MLWYLLNSTYRLGLDLGCSVFLCPILDLGVAYNLPESFPSLCTLSGTRHFRKCKGLRHSSENLSVHIGFYRSLSESLTVSEAKSAGAFGESSWHCLWGLR